MTRNKFKSPLPSPPCRRGAGGIGARITFCSVPKPAKRAWSFSPWRASRGITRPLQFALSPVGAASGHADNAPTGLKIFRLPHVFPWLARHGLNDHATPWLTTLRHPTPLIKGRDTGSAGIPKVILAPMGAGGEGVNSRYSRTTITWVKTLAILGLLFLAVGAAAGADKEKPLPKALPPYGELKPFQSPKVTTHTLANGLTVWLVPRPGFPKVSYAIAVRGGLSADPQDRPGLAELLTSTIDQGTATRTAKQIAEELQAAGGDLGGNAGAESIVIATERSLLEGRSRTRRARRRGGECNVPRR